MIAYTSAVKTSQAVLGCLQKSNLCQKISQSYQTNDKKLTTNQCVKTSLYKLVQTTLPMNKFNNTINSLAYFL